MEDIQVTNLATFWMYIGISVFNAALIFIVTYYLRKIMQHLENTKAGRHAKADAEMLKKLQKADMLGVRDIKKLEARIRKLEKSGG